MTSRVRRARDYLKRLGRSHDQRKGAVANWYDFLFGAKPLQQAAGQGGTPASASNASQNPPNAQADMARQAQAYADQQKAQRAQQPVGGAITKSMRAPVTPAVPTTQPGAIKKRLEGQ